MHKDTKTPTGEDWQNLKILWDFLCLKTPLPHKADVAIVGGSGCHIDMAVRASQLYRAKIVPLLVVSGDKNQYVEYTAGARSEAVLLREAAMHHDVPSENILVDALARTTFENITNSEKLLAEHHIAPKSVILVHLPFALRRFLATAERYWSKPHPNFFTTCIDTSFEDYVAQCQNFFGHDSRVIEGIMGEFTRIKTYPEYDFIVKQDIPEAVSLAYDALVNSGFNGRPMHLPDKNPASPHHTI